MNYAKTCRECPYFSPGKSLTIGVCDRVDDPSAIFIVARTRRTCLYDNAGKQMSVAQIRARDTQVTIQTQEFIAYLNEISRQAASWPAWRRELFSPEHS